MTTEKYIPLHILKDITDGFSEKYFIGGGGFGNVYKVVYKGREIAVKLLHVDVVRGLDDKQFKNEVGNLLRVNHPNVIQLVGYCYETNNMYVGPNGADHFSEHIYKVLCFEYMQGRSLQTRLDEQYFAPDWSTRYNIIKGISEGLNSLHICEPQILHLDLKPANILLDISMEPKVADFGLSRLFTQSHTHVTETIIGSRKYMAPEYIKGQISSKNDIFSLGVVMIDIMTASAGYPSSYEMGGVSQLMQQVLTNWSTVIEDTSKYPSEEIHQVQTCIELAIRCVDSERDNRPSTTCILDALNKTEINIPKRQLAVVPPSSTSGPKNTMANTLKTMAAELDNISNQNRNFSSGVQQILRETTSDVEEPLIIGRTEEKEKLLATLCGSITPDISGRFYHRLSLLSTKFVSNFSKMVNWGFGPRPQDEAQVAKGVGPPLPEITVLPIYGIGGIGKTTLAQLVFNDSQFAGHSRVWVYVSENFDLDKIGNSIISQLSEMSHVTEKQVIHNHLRKLLAGKKILIVLDDLWEGNPDIIRNLKTMLRLGAGSMVTVIVTTRYKAIAREICHSVEPYKLETLTDEMCWTIIKQKTAFEDQVDKEQLKHIGREIAKKCGGVPLAAQSLGYTLNGKTSDEWESVRDNHMWNLSTSEDPSSVDQGVLVSLLLSYNHMPDWLKLCFSYCAVFPKGFLIAKYDLIHLWIALGFTEQSGIFDSMQLCEKYVTQLLGMSFLQYSKTRPPNDGWLDKDSTFFTMHDLVHDLARAILADQVNDKGNAGGNRCRYALLTDCTKPLQLSVTSPANIRALHFLGCRKLRLQHHVFSHAECLRVLDLSECYIPKLPDSIGQLRQLRFLHAPRIKDQMFPKCITKLSELNYLNLRGSRNISSLPDSIGDLKGLMHLDLSGCGQISKLPKSFAELKQLVHLDLLECFVPISDDFCGLTKLQHLNLSVKPDYFEYIDRRELLEFIGNLKKLRYLNLSGCIRFTGRSEYQVHRMLDSISTLSNLEHLDLSENENLTSIPESIGNLRKLHTLDLSGCYDLEKLPDSMVNMVSLKVLKVDREVELDESVLSLLNIVSLPHFVVHASSDKFSSNIIRLKPTNPAELTIDRLENVKSVEEAQSIKLIEKQKIQRLAFQWTVAADRFVDDEEVLEKLVPPSSLKKLSITGYSSASIPYWLVGIGQYLPNIIQVDLTDFPKCNDLPPLGQLPNLEHLSLCRMEGLEEWSEEGVNVLMFPKLETLRIEQCTSLSLRIKPCLPRAIWLHIEDSDDVLSSWGESSSDSGASSYSTITRLVVVHSKLPFHQWRLLHHLPALHTLIIKHCRSDVTTSPEIIQQLSSLKLLSLQSNQPELPRWLVELTSLQNLELNDYRSLTSLPQWLVKMTSLQGLELSGCGSMASLPQWLGELTSLKIFVINNCKGISSLPDSIQQLTNLEHLYISCCPALRKWCESEENKIKIAHIRKVSTHGTGIFLGRS